MARDVRSWIRIIEKVPVGKYRARDPKLNRDVALKILPDIFALNHPHIAAIYGFEESQGVPALVFAGRYPDCVSIRPRWRVTTA